MQYHQMACELAASAVEPERTFKWVPYSVQVQMTRKANCMTATVARTRDTRGVHVMLPRPATRAAGCYNVNVTRLNEKKEDDENAYLYDSD